ncbi:Putative Zn-dependent protease, contains TPR repeats [Amphritea atlantica]|uniref:Putative beta-barrel assembly-enhancing protease n=1 Tax=Amphritea atlantica TaxID=355243 RepID=A0A1H9HZZ2_9GAMM|nr:M48 family metalloprotease [Amphritea atlantica]SEQ67868.1 Putative Zn-dependent protease, contains TPR repeats [Amphritea atlantica]
MRTGLSCYLLAGILALNPVTPVQADDLPVIASSSGTISLEQEFQLGRTWARLLRGRAPEYGDPLIVNYIDSLLWQIAANSQLQDHRLELIVLDSPVLNAFAVPGGVVGINAGLLLGAKDEEELASVIAHELAHLSQRHYAQQLEESRRNTPLMLAGILASILVASADPQAGMAGITSSMAAGQQAGINFTRRNEQEADRIGMLNLVNAGYDPHAMPRMFSRIQRSSRFLGQKPPEFLLTHPVTESRIADAENRASQLPSPAFKPQRYDFQLIKKRVEVHYASDLRQLIKTYQESASSNPMSRYGLALALLKNRDYKQAQQALDGLPDSIGQHLYIRLSYAELELAAGEHEKALQRLELLNKLYPDSYPVRQLYAKALRANNQFKKSARILTDLSQKYPTNSYIWYELAETQGLAGYTLGVHEARIEYFLLTGATDKALRQIDFALREKELTSSDIARLEQRKKEAEAIRDQIKNSL